MSLEFLDAESNQIESTGSFSISYQDLRRKLQRELFVHPSYYALKLVQAAHTAKAKAIDFYFDRNGRYEVEFTSASSPWWDAKTAEFAFRNPFAAPEGPLRNLAFGFLGSNFESVLLTGPDYGLRVGFAESGLTFERTSDVSPDGHAAKLVKIGTNRNGLERHLLESRCRLSNCRVRIDGNEQSRDALPGILVQKTLEAENGSFGLRLPPADGYEWGENCFLQSGESKQPLAIFGTSELEREAFLESMYLIPDSLSGDATLCLIRDGVIVERRQISADRVQVPGAVAFLDATGLQTDSTGLRIVSDIEALIEKAKLEWLDLCKRTLDIFLSESLPSLKGAAKFLNKEILRNTGAFGSLIIVLTVKAGAVSPLVGLPWYCLAQLISVAQSGRGRLDWRTAKVFQLDWLVNGSHKSSLR